MRCNRIGMGILLSLGIWGIQATSARADFMLVSGNNPQDDENVLLGGDLVGLQITGSTNETGTVVLFESASQFLASPSSGQARIEARDTEDIAATQEAIDDALTISLQDPLLAFQSLIFNAFIGGGVGDGGALSFTVEGFDAANNPVSETFGPEEIGNGENFFTVLASDGQLIQSVTISPGDDSSYADLRQVRIGGIIPEPSTVLLLLVGAPVLAWRLSARRAER